MVVTVIEGRVAVLPTAGESNGGSTGAPATALLSAGEQLTVTPVARSKPRHADVGAATAWMQRRFVFEDTPLAEVAEEFNRYSVRQLVIDDAELARRPISGIYSSADPESLIGFLRAQPQLQVTETAHEIRVARR
jgi:transmembrane sensor